ncbi:MBL fold metallo-hydrolase [Roseomonas sp. BN140053]|uniref:MBL fold metallo-hydrolase n=1 Tax=Roseomonas sp. BN140053 TaxID=3391898 RepID=UPI0039EBF173
MEITILGCGSSSGVPLIGGTDGHGDWGVCDPHEPRNRRTRASIALQVAGGETLLVDAGPDLRAQLLRVGLKQVDALLLTHSHADHIMGLDEMRTLNRLMQKAVPTFGTALTLADAARRFDYAFREPTPGFFRPALTAIEVQLGQRLRIAGLELQLFRQDHKVMDTLGFRAGSFGYSTDVVSLPEESLSVLQGVDTWVVGCFGRKPHPVHAHVERVAEWVARLKPRRTILTHMGSDLDWAWMQANLPAGIEPAFDGMRITVAEP